MKNNFLILVAITYANFTMLAQDTGFKIIDKTPSVVLTGSYKFKHEMVKENVDFKSNTKADIPGGAKVDIISDKNDQIQFRYWNFTNDKAETYNGKIFTLSRADFLELTTPLYRRYKGATVGGYSVPFRIRGIMEDNFDFESSLSLQANIVFGFGTRRSTESWIDVSAGIGLTGVKLTPDNSSATEERSANALTLSLGALYKPAEFANIGLFIGWDNLPAADRDANWVYNGKPWLGLGINITFDKVETTKAPTDKSNQSE